MKIKKAIAGILFLLIGFYNAHGQQNKQVKKVFVVTAPDYKLSPYTGMTRKHWKDAALYLLQGAFSYINSMDDPMKFPKQPGKSYPRTEAQVPTEKLEGLCRTLFIASSLLKEDSSLKINNIHVADYYRYQIAKLIDSTSAGFIKKRAPNGGPSQNLVEFGALSLSLFVAPQVLWDPLPQWQKDALAATMLSYGDGPTVASNWKFFNIFVLSFFKSRGYAVNEKLLVEYLDKSLAHYRGNGWYNDAPAYDYYSMWAFQMYGPVWAEFFGKKYYPAYAQKFMHNFSEVKNSYPYMFSRNGEMIMWGRSMSYRFASVIPFPLMGLEKDPSINYGWMRRISSGVLLQFLKNPDFLQDNIPTLGFYGAFEPTVQSYSCRGSVFWMAKAFMGLMIPENNSFWTAKENEGAWESELAKGKVYNKFQEGSNILITDYPNTGACEVRAWCNVKSIGAGEPFRSSENYNRLSYNSAFPWQADGVNGEVSMNYVIKNKKGEWEPLRLYTFKKFENGIYYRNAVIETDSSIKFNLADIPVPNGIVRVDKVQTNNSINLRLGHYSLPDVKGYIKHIKKKVKGRDVQLMDNGVYQLAMVPLSGWTAIELVRSKGLHPVSDSSAVLNAADAVCKGGLYVTLLLWKRSGEKWSDDELVPVNNIVQDAHAVQIIFASGEKKQVTFDDGYRLVWSDEFNGNTLDTNNWRYETGFVRNNEHQWYQQSNVSVANGILTIEARRETRPNPDYEAGNADWRKSRESIEYTSGSINTSGKQAWQYGRFEMRARIDTASGYWPAWWCLGVNKRWPANGEIDMMEFYRGNILANYAVRSDKGNAYWFTQTKSVSSFNDPQWRNKFHVWKMDWDEKGISIYVDDILLNYQPQDSLYNRDGSGFLPFKQKQYMLLNLAIGGDNGGNPSNTGFPLKYEIDYVRVWQKNTSTAANVKIVPVDSAWAKNAVNAAVFRKNSLVSFRDTQYIAYYNEQGFVVVGKRKTGTANWTLQQTSLKGNVADAHNIISIMVDGDGYLHISWDHHNNRLHYAKSIHPGSLQIGNEQSMTGNSEDRVTYPEFYRLRNGDLLFLYRDGGSGNGNLVINRYDLATKKWSTVQSNLIDGQGQRNAYWQAFMDARGTMHLSWVWRETPDVASNHDMCYARSGDGGKTWEKSTGEKYQLPINAFTAEIAAAIPQRSELINQTSMFADANGNPYVATYWRSDTSKVPQYHLIFKKDNRWQVQDLGFRSTAFTLSGTGTKRIPVSRPQIIAWTNGDQLAAAIIFRDAERDNKVSVAIANDINKNNWQVRDLYNSNVGSWEPSYDTELWKQKGLLHLFVQHVEQADAEGKTNIPPQLVEVLEWDPKAQSSAVTKASVLETIERANSYWQANSSPYAWSFWDVAAYHTGNMEAYFLTKNENYRQYSNTWAEHNKWMGAKSNNKKEWKYSYGEKDEYVLFGDWQICFQTYIDLYNIKKDPQKIARAIEVMEYEISTSENGYWWWADGLYMVMPVMTKLYKVTGNKKYLSKLHEYFTYANSIMYDSTEKLYYRDAKYVYPKHKSVNGKKDFWARGDGWVFAGLAKVLKDMPKNNPHYKEFLNKYLGMAAAIKKAQQPQGYWTRSMLDAAHAPGPETSGTAFFTYGLLWGINNGILNKNEYLPAATMAWKYLTETALQPDGKLGYVQPIGERAIPGQVVDINSTAGFGVGAFLLAACEMYRQLSSK